MNVNFGQPYKESDIKRQLRQRRATFDNQQTQATKPFMSHRKPKLQERQTTELIPSIEDKENIPLIVPKVKRQSPTQIVTQHFSKNTVDMNSDHIQNERMETALQSTKKSLIIRNTAEIMFSTKRQEADLWNSQKIEIPSKLSLKAKRRQVQSIIFDSKVTQFEYADDKNPAFPTSYSQNLQSSHIQEFQIKANKVNQEIQEGLTKIEQLIKAVKKKKQQSQIKSETQKRSIVKNLQKEFADRRAFLKAEESIEKQQHSQTSSSKQSNINPKDSQIQLQGDFKSKSQQFPPQYITFISRLTRQIEKDIEFTAKINELTKSHQIAEIKEMIKIEISRNPLEYTQFDESFFKIQPSELDPLDQSVCLSSKKQSRQDLEQQALSIFKQYMDIQSHYHTKLCKKIEISTIQLLFQQLSEVNFTNPSTTNRSITIGHLLSYLNMRTNKNFRNRSFVKMLKRLNLKFNGLVTVQTLKPLIRC